MGYCFLYKRFGGSGGGSSPSGMVKTVLGKILSLSDSANDSLKGLRIYGKTTQDGIPTLEAPVSLESVGDGGNITVNVGISETDENLQILTIATPNGLPGIPVESGGNYTDENGQQWICDEVDFEKGVYVQRCIKKHYTSNNVLNYYSSNVGDMILTLEWAGTALGEKGKTLCLCDKLKATDGDAQWMIGGDTCTIIYDGRVNIAFKGCATATDGKAKMDEIGGVDILYILPTPIETPLSAEELAQYTALHTNYPNTTIFNDGGAGMEVKYISTGG